MDGMSTMSVKEFREKGYLQELNRCFLHPLGLALAVMIYPDGHEAFSYIVDSREDPEGIIYGEVTKDMVEKANFIMQQWDDRENNRFNALGFIIQPIDEA